MKYDTLQGLPKSGADFCTRNWLSKSCAKLRMRKKKPGPNPGRSRHPVTTLGSATTHQQVQTVTNHHWTRWPSRWYPHLSIHYYIYIYTYIYIYMYIYICIYIYIIYIHITYTYNIHVWSSIDGQKSWTKSLSAHFFEWFFMPPHANIGFMMYDSALGLTLVLPIGFATIKSLMNGGLNGTIIYKLGHVPWLC